LSFWRLSYQQEEIQSRQIDTFAASLGAETSITDILQSMNEQSVMTEEEESVLPEFMRTSLVDKVQYSLVL